MRVSSSQIFNIANTGMRDAQSAINKTSEQLSTGRRVISPADDPVAAVSILRLNEELGRLDQFEKNIDLAQNNLDLEETALDGVTNLLQRVKELTVRAGNTGTLSRQDYQALASEVESRTQELLGLQNTRNASGQYIFAGHQGGTQPFVDEGNGNFRYQGDEGQLKLQATSSVQVPVSDSGKRLFLDIPSGNNTFETSADDSNQAEPPARITQGQIIDQEAFDEFHPRDMRISFNAPEALSPPSANFTIRDDQGRVLVANQPYQSGADIELKGVRFQIIGQPMPGEAATPATLDFGAVGGFDFSAAPETIEFSVGGKTETLVLDRNITSATDLVAALTSTTETVGGSGADRNAEKLANLGVDVDTTGLSVPSGQNIQVRNGSANTDAVLGFATQNDGSSSTNGELAQPGDSFLVEASNRQGLLTTLSRLSNAMRNVEDTAESKAALADVVGNTLTNLDNALTRITEVQGELGARQNTLDSSRDLNQEIQLSSRETLSDIRDVDFAEASTRLQMQQLVLSATQQSFVRVSGLSLFNFL